MKGTVKKFEVRECTTRDKKKFKVIDFTVDVLVDEEKRLIKTLKGTMSEEYARKYFAHCGVKTKDLIGANVEVVVSKRQYDNANGETRTIQFIKYLNVLDIDGNAIILNEHKSNALDF